MILEWLADFVFPKRCVSCGEWGDFLCDECGDKFEVCDQICPECCEESVMGWTHERCKKKWGMDGLIVIYEYQEEVMKAVIDEIKFGFNRELVKMLVGELKIETGVEFDYLVPVPLHFYRKNWRGFNQAEEIAIEVGKRIGLESKDVLVRWKNTKQQSLSVARKDREVNVRGAFEMQKGMENEVKGKKVLLVDDVFTSGASMKECARILKNNGATTVWGLVLAH